MRPRKIDDTQLIAMLERNIPQQDIAKHFKVSPAAICQRLKRLMPKPDLEKYGLTEPQKRFAIAKAQGKTNAQAALTGYEVGSLDSAKVLGSQLMDKPVIRMAIEDLMNHHGLSRSYRIGRLRGHVDNRDPNISLKALDMTWKLDGSYAPEKQLNVNTDISVLLYDLERIRLQKAELMKTLKSINKYPAVDVTGD